MRMIPMLVALIALALGTTVSFAAGATISVRAIAFVASNQRGANDPRLAPYEATLRRNLRFESFRYVGESSGAVSGGGSASLSLPGGGQVELRGGESGTVQVRRGGTAVTVTRGHPAVFMGGPAGQGGVSGVIVMVD